MIEMDKTDAAIKMLRTYGNVGRDAPEPNPIDIAIVMEEFDNRTKTLDKYLSENIQFGHDLEKLKRTAAHLASTAGAYRALAIEMAAVTVVNEVGTDIPSVAMLARVLE